MQLTPCVRAATDLELYEQLLSCTPTAKSLRRPRRFWILTCLQFRQMPGSAYRLRDLLSSLGHRCPPHVRCLRPDYYAYVPESLRHAL